MSGNRREPKIYRTILLAYGITIIWLYKLTDEGLALELTVKGTKYYKAGVLN